MTATLIGATGLIGNELLQELLADNYFATIRLLVRKPLKKMDVRIETKLIDFNDPESFKLGIEGSDAFFVAVGTTQSKVKGDKAAYRKVDYDIPVRAAQFCKETGCENFILVSSAGADANSNNFYLKLKGEVEEAVKKMQVKSVHIMRPSILLGNRKEFRLGEKIGKAVMKTFSFLVPAKYKPIFANDVARAMLCAAKKNEAGFWIYEYGEIKRLIR